ncbi:MAG: DNA-binding protein [Nitrosopumilus sp. B06]|nr:MAG: DNA-binding protein [Nitrosopumilus sp. B06]
MDLSSSKKPTDAEEILSEFDPQSTEPEEQAQGPEFKPAESEQSTEPTTKPAEPTPELPTEQKSPEPQPEENTSERNAVFIGAKHLAVYIAETLNLLSTNTTVTLKARGKKITQAVNVSQMLLKRMDSAGCVISDVRISSEMLLSDDGKQRRVSLMEIDISKN